jgi:hypothetical protein
LKQWGRSSVMSSEQCSEKVRDVQGHIQVQVRTFTVLLEQCDGQCGE